MTNPNTGKVPLTVYLPATKEGEEWHQMFVTVDEKVAAVSWELRPIVPATVTLEGILREDAEFLKNLYNRIPTYPFQDNAFRVAAAARAALARKPESPCRYCGRAEQQHDSNICTGYEARSKPCPVMVCRKTDDSFGECIDASVRGCRSQIRRPCKHYEGHEKDGSAHA